MANHDPNHSSHERTILWTILPATVAVSLLFTKLNHNMNNPGERMSADISGLKKEIVVPAKSVAPDSLQTAADTTHTAGSDTAHTAPHGAGH